MYIEREREIEILKNALKPGEARMIMVQGKRGVGKTSLIKETCKDNMLFELTGIPNGTKKEQLNAFTDAFNSISNIKIERPKDWLNAIFRLQEVLDTLINEDKRYVIFFDEISHLTTPNSLFISCLGHFWNIWASRQNVVVVICDSDDAWVLKNVIRVKGGLHNRISRYIDMEAL